ncbi:hypothetical protein [Mucilaginibacter sp.]|uniref:hypothetical protein n=1 Tax=Mucilaginibacter sp. TaxID=1882438 RepID=UPI0026144A27|nr:hypothetical protein [Mucilaginibacter sp.]MDB4925909.1 hypothetical protein [Mucilaginibacter sp.]
MKFPQFTLRTNSMIQANINSQTYFFTINHITKEPNNKLIYGIRLNKSNYFLSKTSGVNDAEQLDNNLPLEASILNELSKVITTVELKYTKRPPLELMNSEVFRLLIKLRNLRVKVLNPV